MKFAQFALVALVVVMSADFSSAGSSTGPTVVTPPAGTGTTPPAGTGTTIGVTGPTTTTPTINRFNGAEHIRPSALGLAALIVTSVVVRRFY